MKPKRFVQCLLAGLALTGAPRFVLQAQEDAPPPVKNPDRPALPAGSQAFFLSGLGPVGNVLTEEQRASFRRAMESQREKLRDTETKLRDARKKLLEASLAGTFDEAVVRPQALAVAALEADLSVIRAKALSQLQPPLSPEQVAKVKNGLAAPPRNAERLQPLAPAERRHNLTSTNRDENDLPRKR